MPTARNKQAHVAFTLRAENKISGLISFAATQLAVAGCVAMAFPSTAADIPTSYRNAYRSCAGRLESVGITAQAAASACAQSLRPVDLSHCVARIQRQTTIVAEDALPTCGAVRQPIDLARCVIGISENNQGQPVPGVLNYCGRSLLPATYGECVIGLRRELEIPPNQALETCISTDNRPREFDPTFIPLGQLERLSSPAAPTTPTPGTSPAPPAPAPATPPVQPTTP